MSPEPNHRVLMRGEDTGRKVGDHRVETGMSPGPGDHRSGRRQKGASSLRGFRRERGPAHTFLLGFWLPDVRKQMCSFKPPGLRFGDAKVCQMQ